jgi:hypothetical protein
MLEQLNTAKQGKALTTLKREMFKKRGCSEFPLLAFSQIPAHPACRR